ncbi:Protein R12H7.4 [Aphelenchoides avenae]|nr:Protein R12H7.4 [Aphelenchus avenae]
MPVVDVSKHGSFRAHVNTIYSNNNNHHDDLVHKQHARANYNRGVQRNNGSEHYRVMDNDNVCSVECIGRLISERTLAEEPTNFGVCNVSILTGNREKVVKGLFYFTSAWIVLWIVLTIITNIANKQVSHNRFLDMYQELALMVVFVFLGVFVLMPDNKGLCKATTIVLHFFLMFVMLVGWMQAMFASSLIKGTSSKNGRLPAAVNYIWPIFFAAIPTVICYFTLDDFYASTNVHCFASIFTKFFWAFAIPAWVLWFIVLLRNQLAVVACRQNRLNVDKNQLFWARKTIKGLPLLLSWFCMCYFTLLFAVDMQLFWLCIVYAVLCLVYGPMIFVLHTYCYVGTSTAIFNSLGLGFYKPCPMKKGASGSGSGDGKGQSGDTTAAAKPADGKAANGVAAAPGVTSVGPGVGTVAPAAPLIAAKIGPASGPFTNAIIPPLGAPSMADLPPQPVSLAPVIHPPSLPQIPLTHPNSGPTSATQFHEWLTDGNMGNITDAENVLFRPRQRD